MKRSLKYLIAFLVAIIAFENGYAQSRNIDTLLTDAEQFAFEAPEKALRLADYALKHTTSADVTARANLIKSETYKALSRYDLAMEHAFTAAKSAIEIDDLLALETQLFTFHLFQILEIPVQPEYFPALRDIRDPAFGEPFPRKLKVAVAMELGRENIAAGDTAAALRYFEEAESLSAGFEASNFAYGEPLIEIASLQNAQGKADAALQSLTLAEKRHSKYQASSVHGARILYERSRINIELGKSEMALGELATAAEIANSLDNVALKTEISLALIDAHRQLGAGPSTQDAVEDLYTASADFENVKNAAMNAGHTGMIQFLDSQKALTKARQDLIVSIVLGLLGLAILIAIFVLVMNRFRYSNLSDIIKYLESSRRVMAVKERGIAEPLVNRASSVSKSTEEQLVHKLREFEKGDKYLSQDMSLAKLASLLDTNTKYLSEVINQQKGKNFNTYINELRVSYIIEKLKTNPTYLNYKVSYLAEECGFSSHSSFTTVFKSISGISPAKFIALIELEKENKLEPNLT